MHTLGPWKLQAVGGLRAVVDANGHLVRTTWHWKETECHANAQAISARAGNAGGRRTWKKSMEYAYTELPRETMDSA